MLNRAVNWRPTNARRMLAGENSLMKSFDLGHKASRPFGFCL